MTRMRIICRTGSLSAVTRGFAATSLLLSLHACAGSAPVATGGEETLCVNPRPEVCTMEYDPVCAVLADGGNATRSNACSACADAAVVSYRPGACEE